MSPRLITTVSLPPGQRLVRVDVVDSTNAEVLGLAARGERSGLWLIARAQGAGRGRSGRAWSSPPGNLYASCLIRPGCPLTVAHHLALIAPVALFDAVATLFDDAGIARPNLRLKWPNDLLVDGAKVSGILIESTFTPGILGEPIAGEPSEQLAVVLGFGLNLVSHPAGLDQPVTDLARHGLDATPEMALHCLARSLLEWLDRWALGAGFALIRAAWLDRAGPIGEMLSVRVSANPGEPRVSGRFAGLDETGALLLDHADGSRSRHLQGDVALAADDR